MFDIVHNKLKVSPVGLEYTDDQMSPDLITFNQHFKQQHFEIIGQSIRLMNLDDFRKQQKEIESDMDPILYAREIIDYSYENVILNKHIIHETNLNVKGYSFNNFKQIGVDEYLSDPTHFYHKHWSTYSDVLNLVQKTSVKKLEHHTKTAYDYLFDTLHLQPTKAIKLMSKAYPRLEFELEYIIPDGQIAGREVFIDGQIQNIDNTFTKQTVDDFIKKYHTI